MCWAQPSLSVICRVLHSLLSYLPLLNVLGTTLFVCHLQGTSFIVELSTPFKCVGHIPLCLLFAGYFIHCRDPLSYVLFKPVLHDWCSKGCGMCYPVCGMVHIKEPLLLIEKSSPCCGGSGFPLSLSEWSFTICLDAI